MTKGEAAIARARLLIGTRFVAQGRDPAIGLDCVGLALLAFDVEGTAIPDDYRLSGSHGGAILAFAKKEFRRVSRRRVRVGDMLLLRPGATQWHLGLWTGNGVIHADGASRRVVERPGAVSWPIAAVLRRRTRPVKGI
jgi:cell wall-associated NlpC family hydrolase